jgi:nitroimidazol reductase NimA-like FMN-containing flavoprotein (pyridoxamine 5'-phosphate oxidase superfamily)
MTPVVQPSLSELTAREADALLKRNWIARLAYSWHDRVDIEPIHYVYDAPWIFGRTSTGAKLLMLAHNEWCAVEIDEVKDLFDWESVIVKGPFSAFNSEIGTSDKFDRALAALRKLVPNALRDGDPTPERKIVFGIHASEVTGRRMVSHG